jgi:hypothetical protein
VHAIDGKWDALTCENAAKGGHLQVLQWARANGAPWNDLNLCAIAARKGYLHILRWARANGAQWDKRVHELALSKGHQEIVDWALANGAPK